MKRAVIVGSGLAGLSAGYRLSQLGWQVTVFESLGRVGGRVLTESEDGFLFDVGPTIVTDNYSEYLKLVADVGLSDALVDCAPEIAVMKGNDLHIVDTRKPLRSFLTTKLLPPSAKLRLLLRGLRLIKLLYRTNPYDLGIADAPVQVARDYMALPSQESAVVAGVKAAQKIHAAQSNLPAPAGAG
jgi:phytoene dehydrogenase-like protein